MKVNKNCMLRFHNMKNGIKSNEEKKMQFVTVSFSVIVGNECFSIS